MNLGNPPAFSLVFPGCVVGEIYCQSSAGSGSVCARPSRY